jgi:predicted ArsR family transcriptional regulator
MTTTTDRPTGDGRSRYSTGPEPTDDPLVRRPGEAASTHAELLTDDYARSILEALDGGPERARTLADACEGSRATVYRRLNRLVEAGLVAEETALDPDGHHCKRFRVVRNTVTVTVEDGGISVTARST